MKIKQVMIMNNGMVAVFDETDHQVPELQGPMFEVMEKIGKASDEETQFFVNSGVESDISWYFQKRDGKEDG